MCSILRETNSTVKRSWLSPSFRACVPAADVVPSPVDSVCCPLPMAEGDGLDLLRGEPRES